MNDEVLNMSQVISNAFKNIRCEDVENANKLFDVWKEILFSIQGSGSFNNPGNRFEGQNLYDHSRILDLKNGMLLIEADHPGWIQLLQMHKKYILTGLKKKAPDLKINNMVFKLKGAGGELADVEGSSLYISTMWTTKRHKELIEYKFERGIPFDEVNLYLRIHDKILKMKAENDFDIVKDVKLMVDELQSSDDENKTEEI